MSHLPEQPDPFCPVSILVFVELALDVDRYGNVKHSFKTVSILVFVELALDELAADIRIRIPLRFNPCFRGTCS